MLWCGEVLDAHPQALDGAASAPFTNLYGPTEATIASSYYTVPAVTEETDDIPIGTACDGEELLVLDGDLRPTPPGEIGDLYIAGQGLSPGYWRDTEKTAAAFSRIRARHRTPPRASIAPATSHGWTRKGLCASSAGRIRRSRAAATASSSARSRRR